MTAEKKKPGAPGRGKLRIRMIGSVIGCPEKQRATVRGLGLRRPDPYKQKGIRYVGERLKKKAGKAGATGTGAGAK